MLSVLELEMLLLIQTDCLSGLSVKISRIQLQREVFRHRRLSFPIRCGGMIVLNADLKSLNSIHAYVFFLCRRVRARCAVVAMARSVC